MKSNAFTLIELLIVLTIIAVISSVMTIGNFYILQIPFYLLFGWIWGIMRILLRIVQEPVFTLILLSCLATHPLLLHRFQRLLLRHDSASWSFRRTGGVSLLLGLIICSVASVSVVFFDTYRLCTTPMQALDVQWDPRVTTSRMLSYSSLRSWFLSADVYSREHCQYLVPGGTLLEDGRPGHGWMTQLLPYMEQQTLYDKIDLSKPWNDPANAPAFRQKAGADGNTRYFERLPERQKFDADGFRRTDYAANERLMPIGHALRMEEITDGTSNTIFCGEAMGCYQPWGSPLNGRDAALGVNRSPFGFGNANDKHGCVFAFCDGSVRFMPATTDPDVMRALATPDEGEKVYP